MRWQRARHNPLLASAPRLSSLTPPVPSSYRFGMRVFWKQVIDTILSARYRLRDNATGAAPQRQRCPRWRPGRVVLGGAPAVSMRAHGLPLLCLVSEAGRSSLRAKQLLARSSLHARRHAASPPPVCQAAAARSEGSSGRLRPTTPLLPESIAAPAASPALRRPGGAAAAAQPAAGRGGALFAAPRSRAGGSAADA